MAAQEHSLDLPFPQLAAHCAARTDSTEVRRQDPLDGQGREERADYFFWRKSPDSLVRALATMVPTSPPPEAWFSGFGKLRIRFERQIDTHLASPR